MRRDRTRQGAELRKRASVFQRSTQGAERRNGSERRKPHADIPLGAPQNLRSPLPISVAGFLLSMRRDSNPTGCGAEETRKRFPAQHARSEATQRMRAAPAHADIPLGAPTLKCSNPPDVRSDGFVLFAVIRRKVLNALALDKQLALLPFGADFAQHLGSRREHDGIYRASAPRTHGNATHAGNAGLFVHPLGIVFIDSANRARCGTSSASGALFCGLGHHTGAPGLLIGTIARNSRLRSISCRYLLLNLIRKPSELRRVLWVWPTGCKLANNRMLGDGRNRRDHPKARAFAASSSSTSVSSYARFP